MKKRHLIPVLILSPLLFLTGCGLNPLDEGSIWTPSAPTAITEVGGSGTFAPETFTPGTFTGLGTGGFYGNVKVEVTFDDSSILDIEVVYSNETPDFADPAFEQNISDILSTQSANVDAFSGATMSSNALISAVEDAMEQAHTGEGMPTHTGGTVTGNLSFTPTPGTFTGVGTGGFYGNVKVEVTFDETSIVDIQVVYSNETPDFADPAFEQNISDILSSQSVDVDVFSGATMSSNALISAVEDAIEQSSAGDGASTQTHAVGDLTFTPGTFTGVGSGGFGGDITVEVTFEADRIVDIQITDHDETPSFMDRVEPVIPVRMIEEQSTEVDSVSGATMTVDAIKNAVNDAINQAAE